MHHETSNEHYYGEAPFIVGKVDVRCNEMMFYQDMPIHFPNQKGGWRMEERLRCFTSILMYCSQDFRNQFGKAAENESYIYISAKRLFQPGGTPFNRPGWHCDGFMSDDINYIWSDCGPTQFNVAPFNLSQDDSLSMLEMEQQAKDENIVTYGPGYLIRLNQYNVHRVNPNQQAGVRTFFKLTFSKKKFNLIGNAHNYRLDYHWDMIPRSSERNIPHADLSESTLSL